MDFRVQKLVLGLEFRVALRARVRVVRGSGSAAAFLCSCSRVAIVAFVQGLGLL